MAWTVVSKGKADPADGSVHTGRSATGDGPISVGDFGFALIARGATSNDLASDTLIDSLGNVWRQVIAPCFDSAMAQGSSAWYTVADHAGTPTLSSVYPAAYNYDSLAFAFAHSSLGVAALDTVASTGTSQTLTLAATADDCVVALAAPSVDGCIILSGFANLSTAAVVAAGTGFTADEQPQYADGGDTLVEHLVQSTAAGLNVTASVGATGVHYSGVAVAVAPTNVVAAPTNTSPPTITGVAQVGQALGVDEGHWFPAATGYGYQWQNDGGGGGTEPAVSDSFDSYAAGSLAALAPAVWPVAFGDSASGNTDGAGAYGGDGTAAYRANYYATGGARTNFRFMFTIAAMPGTGASDAIHAHFRSSDDGAGTNAPTDGTFKDYYLTLNRQSAGNTAGYMLNRFDPDNLHGSSAALQAQTALAYAVGDTLGVVCNGNTIVLWRKPSGGVWATVNSWTDANLTGGYVGFEFFGTTTAKIGSFSIDNATSDFGAGGSGWADIASAAMKTYTLQAGDLAHNVRCNIVATNTGGSSVPVASNSLLVSAAVTAGRRPRLMLLGVGGGRTHSSVVQPPPNPGGAPALYGPWFATNSPWRTPIPSDWQNYVHPDTPSMVMGVEIISSNIHAWGYDLADATAKWGASGATYVRWLGPGPWVNIVYASASDPFVTVYVDYPSYKSSSIQLPLPANWTGYNSPGITGYWERRTAVVCDDGRAWVLYQETPPGAAPYNGGAADAYWHATTAALSDRWTGASMSWSGGGSGIAPGPGTIIPSDYASMQTGGWINHALAINSNNAAFGTYTGANGLHPSGVWPATKGLTGTGGDGKVLGIVGIPHGCRVFLDPSLTDSDLVALGLSKEWMLQLARTFQKYGCMSSESTSGQGDAGCILSESNTSITWNAGHGKQGYGTAAAPFRFPWVADGTVNATTNIDTSVYNDGFPAALVPLSGSHWKVFDWRKSYPGITVAA